MTKARGRRKHKSAEGRNRHVPDRADHTLDYERGLTGRDIEPTVYARQCGQAARKWRRRRPIRAFSCYPTRESAWRVQGATVRRQYPVIGGVSVREIHGAAKLGRAEISPHHNRGVWLRDKPIVIPGDVIRVVMGLPTRPRSLRRLAVKCSRVREGDRARIATGPFVRYHRGRHQGRVRQGCGLRR